jgi:4-aminobutyrate aminotransferase
MDWPPGAHASTFGGNPVSCRAALATLDLIERQYLANAIERGAQLAERLKQLTAEFSILARPRGLGLMQAVDFEGAEDLDRRRLKAAITNAFHRGLLLLGCGRAGVRFCPPLCVTAEEIDRGVAILREVLIDVARDVR